MKGNYSLSKVLIRQHFIWVKEMRE